MLKLHAIRNWGDNLGDPHGNVTTLYQEIAKEIFDAKGVLYYTVME